MRANSLKYAVFLICLLTLLSPAYAAIGCTYSTVSNSADYTAILTSADKTIALQDEQISGDAQLWNSFKSFTPKANFVKTVNDSLVATGALGTSTINWKTSHDFSGSLVVKQGVTTVDPSNYTLLSTGPTTWAIQWLDGQYNGQPITIFFSRTFEKNVDDIVTGPDSIYSGVSTAYYLSQNTPVNYGEDKTFRFRQDLLGKYVDNSDWTVGWNYTQRTCSGTTAAAITGISSTKLTLFAGFGLLAILLLATAAFGIIKVFGDGNGVDFTTLAIIIIGGAIILFIGYIIVSAVATSLGA